MEMKVVTESLKASFDRGWEFLNQIIEVCPDDVWNKKAGGYYFWQQLYHCFACADIFIMPKGGALENPDIALFKTELQSAMSKEEVKKFGSKMKGKADAWIESLDDAALCEIHEGFSEKRGSPVTNALAFTAMISHSSYHIGSCDAILRDNGQKGVL